MAFLSVFYFLFFISSKVPLGAVSSLSEDRLEDMVEKYLDKMIQHTGQYFVRVYPAGLRTDSGNYSPLPGLIAGCQLVSLNFQTSDKYLNMFRAFFSDNGGCGYVLKPAAVNFLSSMQDPPAMVKPIKLTVHLVSAVQLAQSDDGDGDDHKAIDPYVKVKVYGVKDDETKAKSKTMKDDALNPVWNDTFEFQVTRPDVALLRFVVMDRDTWGRDDFVAQYTVPIRMIRQGLQLIS